MIELGVFFVLLIAGYVSGRYYESKHYRSILARERKYRPLPTTTLHRTAFSSKDARDSELFSGSVVIALDYFKLISASLRNLVGGKVIAFESLLDRARREAVLRVQEKASAWGATEVINLRVETSTIGQRRGGGENRVSSIEVIAYATGVK